MNPVTKFPYPRRQFLIRAINLLVMLVVFFIFTLTLSDLGWLWPSLFFIIFLITIIITTITPLLTAHEVGPEGLILRQGLLFKACFAYAELEGVEKQEESMWALGMPVSRSRGRITIASGNRGLVLIKLKQSKRFHSLLYRSGNELVIDLVSPERFIEEVNERLMKV